jgi:hypothetical protein
MSREESAGQNQNVKIDNESFEIVATYKYLGKTITDQNCLH